MSTKPQPTKKNNLSTLKNRQTFQHDKHTKQYRYNPDNFKKICMCLAHVEVYGQYGDIVAKMFATFYSTKHIKLF